VSTRPTSPTGTARDPISRPGREPTGAAREPAYVLLEDGTRFDGESVAAEGSVTAEVVFTTGMSGYQESMTDPSFARQLITYTAPHVGNYGVSEAAMESGRIHAAGAIMRDAIDATDAPGAEQGWLDWLRASGVPAISGVDTRALVRHIRAEGAMRGGIFPAGMGEDEAMDRVRAEPSMIGRDLAREVTVAGPVVYGADEAPSPGGPSAGAGVAGAGPRIIALDTGIKRSIIRNFTSRGAVLELHPCTTPAGELLARDPDGFFLVPGPGDPAALGYIVETIRELLSEKPVFGICLGHQLLSRAAGLETFKLPFGHRGANHPVKDVRTGRIAITSQNHGFAVRGEVGVRIESELGAAELTHVNLYDGTVEGIRLLDVPAGCVQYHPEAGPGPNDSLGLFDEFIDRFAAHA
jgi:carbamoyl-phosphate synthase small subunit